MIIITIKLIKKAIKVSSQKWKSIKTCWFRCLEFAEYPNEIINMDHCVWWPENLWEEYIENDAYHDSRTMSTFFLKDFMHGNMLCSWILCGLFSQIDLEKIWLGTHSTLTNLNPGFQFLLFVIPKLD